MRKTKDISEMQNLLHFKERFQNVILYTYQKLCGNNTIAITTSADTIELYNSLGMNEEDISNYLDHERILRTIISKYPDHNNYDEVLIKVIMLNTLYSAGLNTIKSTDTISVNDMAAHIVELEEKKNLSVLIQSSNKDDIKSKAVDLIAKTGKYKDAYSFASKYCNWHNHDGFPIMDTYTKGIIYYLNKETETYKHVSEYEHFSELTKKFRDTYCPDIRFKELDMFLWVYGKTHRLGI